MKCLLKCGFLLVVICVFCTTDRAIQDIKDPEPRKSKSKSTPPVRTGTGTKGSRGKRKVPTPTPTPVPKASLTIKLNPPDSYATLDGKNVVTKKPDGSIDYYDLSPGEHRIVVKKEGYGDYQRTVQLKPGQNPPIEVTLYAMPGTLSIAVQDVVGANISLSDGSKYVDRVVERRMPAGNYSVKVSKPGYQEVTKIFDVPPGKLRDVIVLLPPLPTEQALAQVRQYLDSKNYDRAIEICGVVLKTEPNNPQANQLMGYSHYYAGRFEQSLQHLLKALDGDLQIEIPIKRYQRDSSGNDKLFSGRLVLRRSNFGFQSTEFIGPDSNVLANKIYELSIDAQKGGRIYALIGVNQGSSKKEKKEKIYYHPATAVINSARRNTIECVNCRQELYLILRLIQRVKT